MYPDRPVPDRVLEIRRACGLDSELWRCHKIENKALASIKILPNEQSLQLRQNEQG